MLVAIALISSSCVGTGDSKLTVSFESKTSQDDSSGQAGSNSSDSSNGNSSGNNSGSGSSSGDSSGSGSSSGDSSGSESSSGDSSGSGSSSSGVSTGNYKRVLTLSNSSSGTVDDVTFRVELDTATLISSGKMNSDCSDIRMVHEGVQLSTWIGEESCNTNKTDIFFKIPSFTVGQTTIDLYYGDLSLTSIHNGDDTFPLYFDDFNRASFYDKTFNGQSYTVTDVIGGNFTSGMGNFQMNYNSSNNKGKLKLNSGSVYKGYNYQFQVNINKTDDSYVILGSKVRWLTTGTSSMLAGGMFFNGSFRQMIGKYTNYTFIWSSVGYQGYKNQGVITSGIDYHYSMELLQGVTRDTCWKNCNWTITKADTTEVSPRTYQLGFYGPYSGNSYELDYYFARKTLPTGDPVITIGAETAN